MKTLVCLCALVAFQPLLAQSLNVRNVVRPLLALAAWNSMASLVGSEPSVRMWSWDSPTQVQTWQSGWQSPRGLIGALARPVLAPFAPFQGIGTVGGLFSSIRGIGSHLQSTLQPLQDLLIKAKMMKGLGGVAVATEGDRSFVIANGNRYVCTGQIQGPRCLGSLVPFVPRTQRDLCYASNFARAGDYICLADSPISVSNIDGRSQCTTTDQAPILQLPFDQHRSFCGDAEPWKVHYIYYEDPYSPQRIAIPSPNVQCDNSNPGICEFDGDLSTAAMDLQGMINMASK